MQRPGFPPDKASLFWQGQTLLERTSSLLEEVCETHGVLCGNEERCARLQVGQRGIADRLPGLGPLGGLEAALADAEKHGASWALIVPVDLPNLTSDLLIAFASRALALQAGACCLQEAGLIQPLPALVRVETLPFMQELLLAGSRKVLTVLTDIARRVSPEHGLMTVETSELQRAGSSSHWFWNVNTPEDFHLLEQSKTSETRLHQSRHGQ